MDFLNSLTGQDIKNLTKLSETQNLTLKQTISLITDEVHDNDEAFLHESPALFAG